MAEVWEKMPGWFDWHALYERVVLGAGKGATIVEIGTCLGKSAAFAGRLIRDLRPDVRFYTIDKFQVPEDEPHIASLVASVGGDMLATARRFWKEGNVDAYIHPIVSDSAAAAAQFEDDSLWFVFVDGDHRYEGVKRDLDAWWPKIQRGRWIGGHDFNMPDVGRAVREKFGTRFHLEGKDWPSWLARK